MSESTLAVLHIEIDVTLNHDTDYSYHDPSARERVSFSVPLSLVDRKNLGKIVSDLVSAKVDALPALLEAKKIEIAARETLEVESG